MTNQIFSPFARRGLILLGLVFLLALILHGTEIQARINCDSWIAAGDISGLIDAIQIAEQGSTTYSICLAKGIYRFTEGFSIDNGYTALPSISTPITLRGNGSYFIRHSEQPFRFFYIASNGVLTLENLTLTNGWADAVTSLGSPGDYGGAIYNKGSLFLNDVVLTGNRSTESGGAISNSGNMTIIQSTLDANTAERAGGAIYSNDGDTVIADSIIGGAMGNDALNGAGLNFYADFGPSSVIITNTLISKNVAHTNALNYSSTGGGILLNGPELTAEIRDNTQIIQNVARDGSVGGLGAQGTGGASYLQLTITNNVRISGNTSLRHSGGLWLRSVEGTIDNAEIMNNSVQAMCCEDGGGGIYIFSLGFLTITNTRIEGNQVWGGTARGGGIYTQEGGALTIIDSTIINNSATWGGSISNFFFGGPITIRNTCIFGNSEVMLNYTYNPEIDARENWWGMADGPSGAGPGSGDSIGSQVLYAPFLTEPAPACYKTPELLAPPDGTITNQAIPTFEWETVAGVTKYNIQIDDNDDFSSPRYNANVFNKTLFKPFWGLGNGTWYWRVRAQIPGTSDWSTWSTEWTLTVDRVRPARPTLTSPTFNEKVTTSTPTFGWSADPDPATYTLQIDKTIYFRSADKQEYTDIATNQFTIPAPLYDGTWFWRVQAVDTAGNVSYWSANSKVLVDALETPIPTLVAPAPPVLTQDRVFTFEWTSEIGVSRYNLQVNSSVNFDGVMRVNAKPVANTFRNAFQPLSNGLWYWRVSALGTDGIWGDWSEPWQIEVDLLRPDRPVLTSPALDETVEVSSPTFIWVDQSPDAVKYTLQVDRNFYFRSPDLHTYTDIGTNAYTLPDILTDGRWFWRVAAMDAAGNQSFWSANSRVFVDAVATPVPTLVAPADGLLTGDPVHTFDWTDEAGVKRYNIQVNSAADFSGVMRVNVNPVASEFRNGFLPLPSGVWYWRVRALGTDNNWGNWSTVRSLEVDRVKPSRPTLADPPNNSTTDDNTPTFTWNAVADADVVGYIIQIDKFYFFASPEKIQEPVAGTSYAPSTPLADRRWFWRVAAVDAAANVGPWSQFWSVSVDTGASATQQVIQSDSPQVQRTGQWQPYNLGGGSYLASKGSSASLSLSVTGSQIEVVFAKHATLGTFAIEVDGVVVQTVNSRTPNALKLGRVTIPLTPGEHIVRVVTVKGPVVIDAFVITP